VSRQDVQSRKNNVFLTGSKNDRYKFIGAFVADRAGNADMVEFLNVSKNDALAWPSKVHREYPATVNSCMASTVRPFIEKSVEIVDSIFDVFNYKLGLPRGTLANKHRVDEPSGCESRCIKSPPMKGCGIDRIALPPHTDFGSLVSFVFVCCTYCFG
jgi:hypothetical protein